MAKSASTYSGKHLLVIPTYNCVKQISRLIDDLKHFANNWNEIWFIDNGSKDGTDWMIQELISNLETPKVSCHLFLNRPNIGLGGTHKVAILRATSLGFQSLTIFHGDHQAKAIDAVRALEKYKNSYAEFVLGSRFMADSTLQGYSKTRLLFNRVMNFSFSVRLKRTVSDLGSGVNVYPMNQLSDIDWNLLPNDLTFNIEMLKWLVIKKKSICWIPISWSESDQVSNVRVVSQTLNTFVLLCTPFGLRGQELPAHFKQETLK